MKKCCGMHTLRIAVGITMLALLLAGSANAANLTVCPSGCAYSGINEAINAASSGDTIEVHSGTYYGNVNVNKQLTLRGIGMPVVDAMGGRSAITLSANGITLEGFKATRAYDDGYGIRLVSSSNNTLIGNNASNNGNEDVNDGGGISLEDSRNNTLIGNNVSNNYEFGISLYSSSNNMLIGNTASNNYNSGISLSFSSNNTLTGNNASNNHFGISLVSSSNNTINGNNGGISLDSSSDNTMTGNNASNNHFGISLVSSSNNTINGNNGGISLYDSNNNTMIGNNASNNSYGIWLDTSRNNTINSNNASNNIIGIDLVSSSNNTLSGNIASNNTYGIRLVSSSSNNTLISNNASNNGNEYGSGAGISLESSINNKIYNNIFNNIFNYNNNFDFQENNANTWNTKKQSGTNIIGGPILGGNFWANPEGTGFSQTCKDMNGNGICEKRYILDENNIDYLPLSMNFKKKDTSPPKSVSNLKNVSYAPSYINWTWKDPKDIDFKKVMVFIDDKFKKNVSKGKGFYNATNLTVDTRHTISTWTVDMNGNINKTWTNHSAWTAK